MDSRLRPVNPGRDADDNVRALRDRLFMALQVGGMGVWEYDLESQKATIDNATAEMFGLDVVDIGDQDLGRMIENIPEDDRFRVVEALERTRLHGTDFNMTFRVEAPGKRMRWLKGVGRRTVESNGRQILVGITSDLSAERDAQEAQALLLREMNHRVKNLFAVISAIVTSSAREAATPRDLADDVRQRIISLARAHEITQGQAKRNRAFLRDLLETVLEPFKGHADLVISGPSVAVPYHVVTPLGLIFHEWATNANKYGALSRDDGTLRVIFTVDPAGLVSLDWSEQLPGASLPPTQRVGFGSQLVNMSVRQIGGTLDARTEPQGFQAQMTFPTVNLRPREAAMEQ